jgi:predicted transposase YdaD
LCPISRNHQSTHGEKFFQSGHKAALDFGAGSLNHEQRHLELVRTDTFFYRLLQTFPELVFALSGTPVLPGYRLSAVEVKEKSFRFDGVLVPPASTPMAPIWFVEVQFQRRTTFYWDFFTEVAMYLRQFEVERPCRLLAIFPNREVDSEIPPFYQLQAEAGWLHRVYLNQWSPSATTVWSGALLPLVVAPEAEMGSRVQAFWAEAQAMEEGLRERMLEWLETLLVYRYPKQSREEIARMFALGDLRETRVYQEALSEGIQLGKQEGKQEGEAQLVLRLLTRRLGPLTRSQQQQIATLSVSRLEALAEALLDFQDLEELDAWLA